MHQQWKGPSNWLAQWANVSVSGHRLPVCKSSAPQLACVKMQKTCWQRLKAYGSVMLDNEKHLYEPSFIALHSSHSMGCFPMPWTRSWPLQARGQDLVQI